MYNSFTSLNINNISVGYTAFSQANKINCTYEGADDWTVNCGCGQINRTTNVLGKKVTVINSGELTIFGKILNFLSFSSHGCQINCRNETGCFA